MAKPKTAVVVVNFNTKDLTQKAVKPLLGRDVYVVDNGSSELGLRKALQKMPTVKLWEIPDNLGFAGGNNYVLKKIASQYEYLFLLNSDAQITLENLDLLVEKAILNQADVASCRLVYPDGSFQANAGSGFSWFYILTWLSGLDDLANLLGLHLPSYQESKPWFYNRDKQVGWVSGSVMLLKSKTLAPLGFFDEAIFMYGEDVDLCYRVTQAGGKVMWFKEPVATHIGGASSKDAKYKQWLGEFKGLLYFYRKHHGFFQALILKCFFVVFILLRILVFGLLGRNKYARYYLKILAQL